MKNAWAHAAIILANLIFGLNYAVSKFFIPDFMEPEAVAFARVSFTVVFLWILSLFMPHEKIERRDIWRIALAGLCGVVLNMYLFLKGIVYTSPIDSSIMMSMTPVLVLLISAWLLKESITWRKTLGIILGASGAVLLILQSVGPSGVEGQPWYGNLINLGSSLAYSFYLVVAKPLMEKYHPLTVIRWAFTFAIVFIGPMFYRPFIETDFEAFTLPAWGSLAFAVIAATCITYLCIAYGLKRVRSTTVSIYNYSQPLVAAIVAIIMGIAYPEPITFVCAFLIFGGVYLVTHSKK